MSTAIEWTRSDDGSAGMTWNPLVGCRPYSAGCAKCYAETMSKRLRAMAEKDIADGKNPGRKKHYINVINDKGRWKGGVELVPEALSDPFGWKKPRRVFVNSMSDLFYGDEADERAARAGGYPFEPVPFEYIDRVFAVMALTPQHTYQILTKRPSRMAEYFEKHATRAGWGRAAFAVTGKETVYEEGGGNIPRHAYKCDPSVSNCIYPLPNVWLGTSVENQEAADARIPHLLRCPAAVRFLSCEPLLGAIDLTRFGFCGGANPRPVTRRVGGDWDGYLIDHENASDWNPADMSFHSMSGIHWCITGGESGHGARSMQLDWAREIVSQCKAAGVACFVKQLGASPVQPCPQCGKMTGHCMGGMVDSCGPTHAMLANECWQVRDSKGGDPAEWPEDLRVRQFPAPAPTEGSATK